MDKDEPSTGPSTDEQAEAEGPKAEEPKAEPIDLSDEADLARRFKGHLNEGELLALFATNKAKSDAAAVFERMHGKAGRR